MKRKVVGFDEFAYACPYFNNDTNVNNGYGCDHPKQEEIELDDDGKEKGKCYCFSCPLGIMPDEKDWNNPDVDFDGLQLGDFVNSDGEWSEGGVEEHILINIEPNASDDEKQALYNYECYINRYNKDWDGGTWKHLHRK